ncbi:MAG TPA: hypothetical protein VKP69_00910, partial [Isosphaeraceae bacterium]|nr:hypothetical protein [Isosphaeraceae bacterium]
SDPGGRWLKIRHARTTPRPPAEFAARGLKSAFYQRRGAHRMSRPIRNAPWMVLGVALPGMARVAEGEWASPFDGNSLEGGTVLELRGGATGQWEVGDGTIQGSVRQSMPFRPRGDHKGFRHRAPS